MHVMSKYCKAIPVGLLREFEGWHGNARSTQKRAPDRGEETERELSDSDILFLQEDFSVTRGIFMNAGVVFNCPTPDWIAFCRDVLNFVVSEVD